VKEIEDDNCKSPIERSRELLVGDIVSVKARA
jgi:hypothetical protein